MRQSDTAAAHAKSVQKKTFHSQFMIYGLLSIIEGYCFGHKSYFERFGETDGPSVAAIHATIRSSQTVKSISPATWILEAKDCCDYKKMKLLHRKSKPAPRSIKVYTVSAL